MTALEKMREVFETCTVMAGVEPDFECIYITKGAANALLDEAEAENDKLRELVHGLYEFAHIEYPDGTERMFADRLRELGAEVDV